MTSNTSSNAHFLRRWESWHRRGWKLYLIWHIVGSGILVAAIVCFTRDMIDHGLRVSAWDGLIRSDCFVVGGALFGSVTTFLGRFSNNEERYERLNRGN